MKTIQVRRTRHAGHCWRSKDELLSDVLLWTPTYGQAKAGRQARTYIHVRIQDVALKTCQKRWMIGRSGERGSGISALATQHDDDIYIYIYIYIYIFFYYVNFKLSRFLVNIKMVFSPLLLVGAKLPDDPLRWNFSRRIPTRDLSSFW